MKKYPEYLQTFSKAHSNLTKDIDHLKNTTISEGARQITDLSDIPNLYEYALQRDLQRKALGQEDIMKPLSDEYKNHLLNPDNWTFERITQHKEYLDRKINALENGLAFQEDKTIEADLQLVYDAITAEVDIEGFFTNRDMLYTAEANKANQPEQRIWYAVWNMQLNDETGRSVGDLCFKGLNSNGMVEIGYRI